ncbi:MAG TPA: FtsX-like permease family protein, partial [Vicinamibacterales bacterium]|nr:FtsX-like permease family protein [Vicinamibacterales bacterium]
SDELSYDRHHAQHRQIFRVVNEFALHDAGRIDTFALTSASLGPLLSQYYADVRASVRFRNPLGERFIRVGGRGFYWQNSYAADPNVFAVFTHTVVFGDPQTALIEPRSAAVSRSFARRYFGERNPLGETLIMEDDSPIEVTLVFEDLPANSHLKYDVLFSMNLMADPEDLAQLRQRLFNTSDYTYVLMREGYDPHAFHAVSDDFFARHMQERASRDRVSWRSWLQPLADVHFQHEVGYDLPTGNRNYLYGLVAVAVLTLLVACINYTNLATARSAGRAKEVGIRKILGSKRGPLIGRFLVESLLIAGAAAIAGLGLASAILAYAPLADLLGTSLSPARLLEPAWLGSLVACWLLTGCVSGAYPALYLSSVLPVAALVAGSGRSTARTAHLRQFLVFLQFAISVAVIACTLIMATQMRHLATRPLGFAKDHRLIVTLRGQDSIERISTLEEALAGNPRVLGSVASERAPGENTAVNVVQIESNAGSMTTRSINHMSVGDDYLRVMGLRLARGRDFADQVFADKGLAVIVNEALVRQMGWDEPLGKLIVAGQLNAEVIGVVKDFNFASLREEVEPFALHLFFDDVAAPPPALRPFLRRLLIVNIAGDDVADTLRFIEATVTRFDPVHPFEYRFLDDWLDRLYLSEQRLTSLVAIFAGVCIFVACLGLFGLATFTTEQRTREIGVRKVFGASTTRVVALLAGNVVSLVLLSAAVGSVMAYAIMTAWLANFAYRVSIGPGVLLLAAGLVVAVASLTVALRSTRTARATPIHALRHE